MAKIVFETKALTGQIEVRVDGQVVALTDEEKQVLAMASTAIKDALPVADREKVSVRERLTAEQRARVADDAVESWTPGALVARLKTAGRSQDAMDVEIALVVQAFMAESS